MSETIVVTDDNLAAAREQARDVLTGGGLVVAPSETMYGVYASVEQPAALRRLVDARAATPGTPLTVCVHDARHVATIADVPEAGERLIASYWPGPLTLVCSAERAPGWELGEGGGCIAVRVPGDPVALHMLAVSGPLACSAATGAGARPPDTVAVAQAALGDAVDLYLDDGPRAGTPSTVVGVIGDAAVVLRPGVIPSDHVEIVASGRLPWGEVPQSERDGDVVIVIDDEAGSSQPIAERNPAGSLARR